MSESLFDHFAWLYIFCREKLFRDDTGRIIRALWPGTEPAPGTKLIELGCGPGFYARRLAARFPLLSVLGVDRCSQQLDWAREKARSYKLDNVRFETDNVFDLSHRDGSFNILIASRLFTILPNHERAISEIFRVLARGGRCLIAEPRYAMWAAIPLIIMRLAARMTRFRNDYREPSRAHVLSAAAFENLFAAQPWKRMKLWTDGRYQYALCEKG